MLPLAFLLALAPSPAPPPRLLVIEAFDFAFRAPASVPAGRTTIRIVNRGTRMHHVQLNKLAAGYTVNDMVKAWRPGAAPPAFMTGSGGPTAAVGGQTLEGEVVLEPGRYAIICWVPDTDGKLHVQKGMMGSFEVVAAKAKPQAAPTADVQITLVDYAFQLPVITAGRRVIRVSNRGPQSHELVMVRLKPGQTAAAAAAWAERGQTGEAPGEMVGGVAALAPGGEGWFSVDITPGTYALLCFVPDQADKVGRPHIHYGMQREVVVPAR